MIGMQDGYVLLIRHFQLTSIVQSEHILLNTIPENTETT